MSSSYIIRLNRSQYIERDRSIAILRLNQCQHYVGQPVQVRYYTDDNQTEVDAVIAIGIDNGIGQDYYKVLSLGGLMLVRNVVSDPPDVSQLTHGEIYLCPDSNGVWSYMYEEGGERQIENITGGPFVFSSIEDRYRWFYRDGVLKREDDFNTQDEIDVLLSGYEAKFEELTTKLDTLQELVYKNNTLTFPIRVSFYDETNSGGSHTVYSTGSRTGVNFVIRVTMTSVDIPSGDTTTVDITSDCTLTLNGETIQISSTENLYTVENVSRTTSYTLVATYVDPDTGVTKTGTAYYTVPFGYPFYYGTVAASGWEVSQSSVLALGNSVVGNEDTVVEFEGALENQRVVIAVPSTYGNLMTAYDSVTGLNCITDYNIESCTVNDVLYSVYIKDLAITYSNFSQVFSFNEYSGTGSGSSETSETSGVSYSDLEALRQEILGGASSDYDTLYEIETKIKNTSNREGLVAGSGISITSNDDGSMTISVNSDESSISSNDDNEIGVTTVDGGYY